MPGEHVLQAFLEQHRERFPQPVQQRQRRRVGEVAGGVGLLHVAEVEEHPRQLGRVVERGRLRAHGHDAEAGGQHEALLRAGHGAVDAPLVHPEVDAADRAHAVHHEERGMLGVVQRLPDPGHVAGDAGGGLVVGEEHGLDLVRLVGREGLLVALDRRALTPLGVEHVDLEAEPLGHVDPEMAEHAEARREHPVARAKGVGERGLPRARAAGREDVGLAGRGLEDLLEVLRAPGPRASGNRTSGGPPSRRAWRGGRGRAYSWDPGRRGSCGRPCADPRG